MNPTTETTLLFAAHMLALLVALGTALVLGGELTRTRTARAAGSVGFVSIAIAEAIHGAGLAAEGDPQVLLFRAAGYLLLLFAAVVPVTTTAGAAAFLPLPAGAIVPAAVGLVAGVMSGWQRRGERSGVWLGVGVMLLAIGDSLLVADRPWVLGTSHAVRAAGYLAVGWFAFAATRHSIRFRMVTGFVALLLAVVIAMSSAVAQVIANNLRQSAIASVSEQTETARRGLGSRAASIQEDVELITTAFVDRFRGNTIRETKEKEARGLRQILDLDFVAMYDADDGVLDRAGIGLGEAIALAGGTVVGGRPETVTFEAIGASRIALIGAQTVEAVDPQTFEREALGVIVGGDFVDADLLSILLPAGTPGAVYSTRGALLASTFPATGGTFLRRGEMAEIAESALGGRSPVESLSIGGRQYFAAAVPVIGEPNTPLGTMIVAQPAAIVEETQRGVTQVIFVVALGAAVLALMLALFVSRRITRPVVALTGAARRVQRGDLGVRAETRGDDEVADLGRAFNSMTASVTTMTEELRDAAEEQARLRARLETVLNSMGDGLIAVNDAGRVVTYNPAAGAILGLPRSRVVGRQVKDVLRGRTADGRPILAGRGATNGLAFVRRQGGDDVPVAITSSPLQGGDGASVGRVYVLRDMTREHQVERMKSEFLSNVSHELRTPLTPIIGYSELLARRGAAPSQAKEFAGGILESAKRLERVVGMLVDFSALEAGRMALSTERVQLGPIIKGVVDAWKGRSGAHRFTTKIPRRLPPVDVDVSLIRRGLEELVDNAVKYSPDGGRVVVRVSEEAIARRRMLRVDVTDEGIGIEPEDLARIFQDFRQVDASDTRMFGGLGLGLTFVQRIAQAHGGRVEATSEPGRGSTFSFLMPAADNGKGRGRKR